MIEILKKRYERFKVPMMITETSIKNDEVLKSRWLKESTDRLIKEKEEGMNIIGYTYFPIIDMYDWDWRTSNDSEKEHFSAKFGFYTHSREERKVADEYRNIIKEWRSENE